MACQSRDRQRIVCLAVESTGGHARADDWEIQGDKVTFKGKGSLPDGREAAWTMANSDIQKGSCVTQLTDLTYDGTKQPDLHWKVPLKRAEAKEPRPGCHAGRRTTARPTGRGRQHG